jgi:hypothetical protein
VVTRQAQQAKRELQRQLLYTLARFAGTGWATADDIVRRLHGRDGRRVAGQLRRLHSFGLVEIRTDPSLEPSDPHDVRPWHIRWQYRVTEGGLDRLLSMAAAMPRLDDDTVEVVRACRSRRVDVAHRRLAGRRTAEHAKAVAERTHLKAVR